MEKAYKSKGTDDFSTNQFSGTMVLAVFAQISIIILDRYLYLSRKFIKIEKQEIEQIEEKIEENASVGHSKSMGSISRISSFNLNSAIINTYIKNKKRKDSDAFMNKSVFKGDKTLEELVEEHEDPSDVQEIKLERNNSKRSIMLKYYFQIFLLIFIHYLVFWYFPNRGNQQIQKHNYCDFEALDSNQ